MRTLLFLVLFFTCFIVSAQTNKPLGTVGGKPINRAFLQNLQKVNPDFSYTEDTTNLRGVITKYYTKQLAMADSVKKLPVYDSLKPVIEDIKKMVEAKVLADYYANLLMLNAIKPTDKEIADYYQANKESFKTIPVYSFFQAYAATDDKDLGKTIKGTMAAIYKQDPATYQTSKKVDSNYTLNFENNIPVYPNNALYSILKTSKTGGVTGPHTLPGRTEKLYLLVTQLTPETIKPLADVKADIQNTLGNSKRETLEKAITNKANKQYPIRFE